MKLCGNEFWIRKRGSFLSDVDNQNDQQNDTEGFDIPGCTMTWK